MTYSPSREAYKNRSATPPDPNQVVYVGARAPARTKNLCTVIHLSPDCPYARGKEMTATTRGAIGNVRKCAYCFG